MITLTVDIKESVPWLPVWLKRSLVKIQGDVQEVHPPEIDQEGYPQTILTKNFNIYNIYIESSSHYYI